MRVSRDVLLPLLAGHVAWSLHLLASYLLATAGCAVDPGAMPVVRHGLTAAAAAVTVWACWAAWVVTPDAGTPADGEAAHERRYAARMTLALNVAFLFAILLAGATGALVQPCI